MPPAVIGGGLAAVGAIGSAVIGSGSTRNAANQAANAQQDATAQQLQLGRESLGLNREIYNNNYALMSPFVGRGNVAGDAYNALLGLPAPPQGSTQPPLGGAGGALGGSGAPQLTPEQQWAQGAINAMLPNITRSNVRSQLASMSGDPVGALNYLMALSPPSSDQYPLFQQYQASNPRPQPGAAAPGAAPGGVVGGTAGPMPERPQDAIGGTGPLAPPAAGQPGVTSQPSQMDAFNNFANSAGMQFQMKQGTDAINNLYAGRGALQSGAAMKGISDYAQNTALSNYFMPYMSMLGGQQATGAQSAAAVAGVGSNFGNTAAGINAQMGSNIQNGANALSNAALLRGQANSQMWGTIGSSLGGFAGSLGGGGGGGTNFNGIY